MSRISLLSSAASASLLLAGQFHMSLVWMPTYGGSKQSPFNVNSLWLYVVRRVSKRTRLACVKSKSFAHA